MPLITMNRLLEHARSRRYAVGYFESWNLESLLSVVDAAERTRSPVIVGFGGLFLGNPERRVAENIFHYGALGRSVAERATVPVGLLLNEADKVSMLEDGLRAGFNAIMHQDPACSIDDIVRINRHLVETAHGFGATVEAEVGELPCSDITTGRQSAGELTDPERAVWFVQQTGIDALAVAVGNVHLLEGRKSTLDFDLLRRIQARTDVPLVLHGGTGIAEDDLREAIRLGVCKVNVGTSLKRVFLKSIVRYVEQNDMFGTDPHDIIGRGGPADMLCGAREAMTEEVVRYIRIFGSSDQAGQE